MPHVPDSLHADHELELIAAYAAGDATGPDLARAETLVATCADCAALHADLRAIAAALPSVPAPARPRDFRIAPDQAATLRPRGLRGILASLSGPRFAFATPLGTGLAALGIVGVLVASSGVPLAGTGGSTAGVDTAAGTQAMQAPAEVPAAEANGAAGAAEASMAASSQEPYSKLEAPDASPGVDRTTGQAPAEAGPIASDGAPQPGAGDAATSTVNADGLLGAPMDPLSAAGIVLIFLGGALVGARFVGLRAGRA